MSRRFVPRRRSAPWVALALWLGLGIAHAASAPAARGVSGMVVAPERHATRAGVEVLRAGGNAVDATVTVSFVLAVTYPLAGNLGGGGFLLYRADGATHHALDFRETAPQKLTAEMFLDEEGRPIAGLSLDSGLAVGVPGTVAGLFEAHRKWGSRPWADLLQPAIDLAEGGFAVYPFLERAAQREQRRLAALPASRKIFTRDGEPLAAGEKLAQPELARTLRRVAQAGPQGFYRGPVAQAIVGTVRRLGGVMSLEDLAAYRPVLRKPLVGEYRGHRVITFPPPSSGGLAMLQILGILQRWNLEELGQGSSAAIHLVAEAERLAFADRSRYLGDPDFVDVPVDRLLDADYLDRRSGSIRLDRAASSSATPPGVLTPAMQGETLHFSVADAQGAAVAATLTLNAWFGSAIVAEGTGVLLNNELDDFALAPGVPNKYGLLGGEANAVSPGKRPLSSMSPTIVELASPGPRPVLALGSPGGSTIISTVLQVLINVIDHRMPLQEAVDAPRFHHQWLPDLLRIEKRGVPLDVDRNLAKRGHRIEYVDSLGNVNAIGIDEHGAWLGAADPRREGLAEGH